ncbi:CatB-related O-acetyltransferase [Pectobacterium cacticida]|uniref:CatB-related O-acetyltransferase n=1 Tax=Pectobacterium cacticida TaxID=69221 RepID=UPI002FF001B3
MISFRWKKIHEEFILDNKIFLNSRYQVKGVHKTRNIFLFRRGEKIKIKNKIFAEEYSMMPYRGFCSVGAFSQPTGTLPNGVSIGRYCSIAHRVRIMGGQHPIHRFTTSIVTYREEFEDMAKKFFHKEWKIKEFNTELTSPIIGNDVWIGDDAVIKGNVIIGDGAVIASNAVVTRNVPAYSIVAGVPAKVIKYRFSEEVISELLALKWWNYRYVDLPQNSYFDNINDFIINLSKKIDSGDIREYNYRKFELSKILPLL